MKRAAERTDYHEKIDLLITISKLCEMLRVRREPFVLLGDALIDNPEFVRWIWEHNGMIRELLFIPKGESVINWDIVKSPDFGLALTVSLLIERSHLEHKGDIVNVRIIEALSI